MWCEGELFGGVLVCVVENVVWLYDVQFGGFGWVFKFFVFSMLDFLLIQLQGCEMVLYILWMMGVGGIYDQFGGGFYCYLVDVQWFVFYFEKMFYDNVQFVWMLLWVYQFIGEDDFVCFVCEMLVYLECEMFVLDGGFYFVQDVDIFIEYGGVEGLIFIWIFDEICVVLGEDVDLVLCFFNVIV